jgi:hypothetical protein
MWRRLVCSVGPVMAAVKRRCCAVVRRNWRLSDRSVRRSRKNGAPQESLEDLLDDFSNSLRGAALSLEQIQSELGALDAKVKKLKEDAAAEAIARRNRERAEPGDGSLDEKLGRTERRIHLDSVKIAFVSFIASTIVAFVIPALAPTGPSSAPGGQACATGRPGPSQTLRPSTASQTPSPATKRAAPSRSAPAPQPRSSPRSCLRLDRNTERPFRPTADSGGPDATSRPQEGKGGQVRASDPSRRCPRANKHSAHPPHRNVLNCRSGCVLMTYRRP